MRMAKISLILSFIPLMVNAWVTQYLPNKVPIHYNLSGEVDGWGSRYSSMIVPITIIISAIVWFLVINHIEKRVQSCEDEKKIKIAVDIDDTLLCTKELEDYYWCQFLKDNPDINSNQEYKWGNPILAKFWSEYREKMAFGKPKKGASNTLNELLSKGYRVDLLSARPLEKYASLKKKLVEYFESVNINYNYLNLGFYSKKEFLKEHHYDILIDNDMKYIEEALSVGVIPILYGNNPNYKGYQTESWEEIPIIIQEIITRKKVK